MEMCDDAHATFLMETRSLDHGIGHIHHILPRMNGLYILRSCGMAWYVHTSTLNWETPRSHRGHLRIYFTIKPTRYIMIFLS